MIRETSIDPKVLAYREPMGAAAWVGLAGLAVVLYLTFEPFVRTFATLRRQAGSVQALVALFLAVVLVRLGLAARAGFTCHGVTVDPGAGTVTVRRGMVVPRAVAVRPLMGFAEVAVRRLVERNGRNERTWFVAEASGLAQPEVRIGRAEDVAPVRRMAEQLGRALGWRVFDESAGGRAEIPPEALDRPLAERVTAPPESPPPEGVGLERRGDGVAIALPAPGMGCATTWLAAVLALAGWCAYQHLVVPRGTAAALVFGAIGAIFLAIGFAILPVQTFVEAGSDGLAVRFAGAVFTTRHRLGAADLRELRLEEGCLRVIGTERSLELAGDHPLPVRAWLKDELLRALTRSG